MSVSALAAALSIGAALSPASPLDLAWDAPAECPDHAVVERRVLDAVGATEREKPLGAIGTISRQPDSTYRLELTIVGDDAAGTRELNAQSCEDLAEASVLIIAIAIDPRAIERLEVDHQPPPRPVTPPPEPAVVEPLPPKEPVPPTAPVADETPAEAAAPKRGPLHVDVVLAPGMALGILPEVSGWFAAGLGLSGRLWRVELDGNVSTPTEQARAEDGDITGEFLLWSVAARGCPVITRGDVEFPLCVGVEAGAMRGRAIDGVSESRTAQAPWAAAFGGAAAVWRPAALGHRFAFGIRAEGVAALARPSFATKQSTLVFQAGRGGGRFAALLAIRLR